NPDFSLSAPFPLFATSLLLSCISPFLLIINKKMGAKEKKAMKKSLKKASALQKAIVASREDKDAEFLPLEGGPGKKIVESAEPVNKSTVLYIGHIPHGFYEEQMEGFFKQFGTVKRLRIARNRKTGKSKHYGFLEFTNPEVAKVVADEMNNYLLFEHNLQIQLVPPEKVHPKLWKGVNRSIEPVNLVEVARRRHNKERTLQEHQKMVQAILKRDEKRRKRIKEAGIDYECPELVGKIQPKAKKIKFSDDQD
ncbi:MKI67 FHA domain-interacting nucleolar phosphoprotein-like, partial [Rhynchospora pubera]